MCHSSSMTVVAAGLPCVFTLKCTALWYSSRSMHLRGRSCKFFSSLPWDLVAGHPVIMAGDWNCTLLPSDVRRSTLDGTVLLDPSQKACHGGARKLADLLHRHGLRDARELARDSPP